MQERPSSDSPKPSESCQYKCKLSNCQYRDRPLNAPSNNVYLYPYMESLAEQKASIMALLFSFDKKKISEVFPFIVDRKGAMSRAMEKLAENLPYYPKAYCGVKDRFLDLFQAWDKTRQERGGVERQVESLQRLLPPLETLLFTYLFVSGEPNAEVAVPLSPDSPKPVNPSKEEEADFWKKVMRAVKSDPDTVCNAVKSNDSSKVEERSLRNERQLDSNTGKEQKAFGHLSQAERNIDEAQEKIMRRKDMEALEEIRAAERDLKEAEKSLQTSGDSAKNTGSSSQSKGTTNDKSQTPPPMSRALKESLSKFGGPAQKAIDRECRQCIPPTTPVSPTRKPLFKTEDPKTPPPFPKEPPPPRTPDN
ncbi:MAG: hypothetical protein JSR76_00580 [Verrucomicrobia bacterium]|nr:hypothetical protein [Verrucomicrobiota bacterium]